MAREHLHSADAESLIGNLNQLIHSMYTKRLYPSSWYGTLPDIAAGPWLSLPRIRRAVLARLGHPVESDVIGWDNRGPTYEPLGVAADDGRFPWYLYWEIYWVLRYGPPPAPGLRILDAGGASSLICCYLSSLGCDVHAIDLNRELVVNASRVAAAMGWHMRAYRMDMTRLEFPDNYFDHAYSICVLEHLTQHEKQAALREIARCLRPGGVLSLTFDYRNPAPTLRSTGPDTRPENQLSTPSDLQRAFLSTDCFDLLGNPSFHDNGKSYLVHPRFNQTPYTFGAIFLKKRDANTRPLSATSA